jgi:SAM-dependent methyltransferase
MTGETGKARDRRVRDGFFDLYCKGNVIDIGAGAWPVVSHATVWDKQHGDATFMTGVADGIYDFVYSSHCLEHIQDDYTAIENWWRILKTGGHLFISVPHRDFYEKKDNLPSRWNREHKRFYLPISSSEPDTISLLSMILNAMDRFKGKFELISYHVRTDGWNRPNPNLHSNGEYSIELLIKKV